MKKTIKKYLVLALVIVAMVTATVLATSAAEVDRLKCYECNEFVTPVLGQTYEPLCEANGYTELICPKCRQSLGATTNEVPALGHNLIDCYEIVDDSYYKLVRRCDGDRNGEVDGEDGLCPYSEVDYAEGTTVPNKYHKVNYINSFVTASTEKDCAYADLAATYKTVVLHSEYVMEGNIAGYQGTRYRMPDKTFGGYEFVGWASESKIKEAADRLSNATTTYSMDVIDTRVANIQEYVDGVLTYINKDHYDIIFGNAEEGTKPIYVENNFQVPLNGEENTPDYNMYAVFDTESVRHTVTFYNDRGAKITSKTVNHGAEVKYDLAVPVKGDNVEYKYTFDYWTLFDEANKIDLNHIYGDVQLKAHFNETLKEYLLKYFESDGKTPIMFGGVEAQDFVTIAGFDGNRKNPEQGPRLEIADYFDAEYEYIYTGEWQISGRGNTVINLNKVNLPSDILDYEQTKGYIALIPRYAKIARVYDLVVYVSYTDDGDYHPTTINLQVVNASGSPVGVATLTEKDIVSGKGTDTPVYKATFEVRHSSSYRITASATNYTATATSHFYTGNPDIYDSYTPAGVTFNMERIKGEPCNCICHTILKPIWVGILNLLNTLFKLEYVCCDDMFANIGGSLNYGPSK